MNDDNIFSPENGNNGGTAPILDDFGYDAPSVKKDGPTGVAAPLLDDMDYVAPTAKKGGPDGVAAPVLDDIDSYQPDHSAKKGAPQNVTAPVLDDSYSYPSSKPEMTIEEEIIAGLTPEQKAMFDRLPPEKQQQVIDMRKAQIEQYKEDNEVKAPVLDEDNYTPPPKEEKKPEPEAPVAAPVLDEAPEPVKYVPKYADEDLERAKREGAKRSVTSQLVSNQKDEKESLRMMLELKAEREAAEARKGFKITILLGVLGVIAGVLFFLLYSGSFFGLSYNDVDNKFYQILANYSIYIGTAAAAASLLLMTGVGGLKSLCSFIYLIFCIIQVFPGFFMIPQHNGSTALAAILYAATFICSVAVFVTISASEAVGLYFKKPAKQYDH